MVDVIINWEVAVPTVRTNVRGASVAAATAVEAATAATAGSSSSSSIGTKSKRRIERKKKQYGNGPFIIAEADRDEKIQVSGRSRRVEVETEG
jgi:hypothetical protein